MDRSVALCLSGQMRTYKMCYGCLQEHILQPYDPDVFVHTWKKAGTTTKADVNNAGEEIITEDTLEKLYSPIEYVIEPFKEEYYERKDGVEVPETLKRRSDHWKGSIPMFYKMFACNELKSAYEEAIGETYDVVIKLRPDLLIRDSIPAEVLENTDVIWQSKSTIDPSYHVSDKFAISSSENMDYYTSVWNHLNHYWENPLGDGEWENIRVGERLMHHHMSESNIEVRSFDASCDILRSRVVENQQQTGISLKRRLASLLRR